MNNHQICIIHPFMSIFRIFSIGENDWSLKSSRLFPLDPAVFSKPQSNRPIFTFPTQLFTLHPFPGTCIYIWSFLPTVATIPLHYLRVEKLDCGWLREWEKSVKIKGPFSFKHTLCVAWGSRTLDFFCILCRNGL